MTHGWEGRVCSIGLMAEVKGLGFGFRVSDLGFRIPAAGILVVTELVRGSGMGW